MSDDRPVVKRDIKQMKAAPHGIVSFGVGEGEDFVKEATIYLGRVEAVGWGTDTTDTEIAMFSGKKLRVCLDEKTRGLLWGMMISDFARVHKK